MSHIHRRVRLPVERARVPAPSDNRVTLAFGLLGLLALVGVIVAIAADEPGLRFLMAGVAVFMVLSVVFMVVLQQGRERGFIGHALKGPLTFRRYLRSMGFNWQWLWWVLPRGLAL